MDHDLASIAIKPMIAGHHAIGRAADEGGESAFAARLGAETSESPTARCTDRAPLAEDPEDASEPDCAECAQQEAADDGEADLGEDSDREVSSMLLAEVGGAAADRVVTLEGGGADDDPSMPSSLPDDSQSQSVPVERTKSGMVADQPGANFDGIAQVFASAENVVEPSRRPSEAHLATGRQRSSITPLIRRDASASEVLTEVTSRQVAALAAAGRSDQLPFDVDRAIKASDSRNAESSATALAAVAASAPRLPMTRLEFAKTLAASSITQPATADSGGTGDAFDTMILPSGLVSPAEGPAGPAGAFAAASPWTGTVAHGVRNQVIEAILSFHGDRTEIALSPEELGSLRLVITKSDAGPTLTVWVERPEVLEMLRRSSDALIADLQEAGLDGSALEFRDGSDWAGAGGDRASSDDNAGTRLSVGLEGHGDGLPGHEGHRRTAPRSFEGGRLDIRV